jgi:hypothetical protein
MADDAPIKERKPIDAIDADRARLVPSGKDKSDSVPLQAEDAARMARLSEEVFSRVMEMSLIISRTLGVKPPQNIDEALRELNLIHGTTKEVEERVYVKRRSWCLNYNFVTSVCEIVPCYSGGSL